MRKILSLCINLLLFIISDAVPLQLIAGDRKVVKKDGATHTISKYYVVPNDFNPNNVTNSKEASQTTLRMNKSLYSKSMDANTASGDQVSKKRAKTANQSNENNANVKKIAVNSRSSLNDAQVEVATQVNDNITKSTGSVSTGQSLDHNDLGNLQVEPITNSININSSDTINKINIYNSSEALQNVTLRSLFVNNATQTFEKDAEDEADDLILTKFGIAVQESSVQNLESFWKLIKLKIDTISDYDELLAEIERLSLLVNIFTNLYEAAKLQKPIEPMIDSIIDILQIHFVEKSNTGKSQSQTDVSGDYDEECLRKCCLKRSKPQLDSNGTYLSETEGMQASDNLDLEKLDLKRRHRGDSDNGWFNTSNIPISNQVTISNKPTNIVRSQLLVPNNLNEGVPDGYNVLSSIPTPALNHSTHNKDNQEDPKSNQIIPDSPETGINTDDPPLTFESILPTIIKYKLTQNIPRTIQNITTDDLPWHIEDKTTDNLPWHIIDKTTNNLPWYIENKTTNNLPWRNEDKSVDHQPFTNEHRTSHILPWTIENKGTKNVPWKVETRTDPNWIIENKIRHSPIFRLYQSRYPSIITQRGKIQPNQPMTSTVHKYGVKKPYHIYTYVINPATSLYEIPNLDHFVKVKFRQPKDNFGTKLYGLSPTHGGNKIVYTNKPSPSYDGSQFSFSKPAIDQTSNSQLKHTNYVTYDISNEVNPSTLISETPQDDYHAKYLVGDLPETNYKPTLLQLNTLPLDSQTNSDQENEEPQVPEVSSHPGVPSNPFESQLNNGPVSTASASASAYTSDVNPDIGDTEPNPYNLNIYLNHIQQTNSHPGLISSSASSNSEYTNLSDDDDEPSPDYGGHTDKHPGFISKSSSSSGYTNLPDEYDEPLYDVQTHQNPGLISSSASSNSEYTNLSDDDDEPSPDYGGHTDKHPGFISTSSSSSGYTNLPDEYDEPVYDVQTHQNPGLISSSTSPNSEYTNLSDDNDEPSPDYGGHTENHPSFISTSSSSSGYTNLPDEYDEPVYDVQTHQNPSLISSSTSPNSEYTNLSDDNDEPSPDYGGHTEKHPGFISTSSSSSGYTNLPDEYDEPVNDVQTHQHPSLISSSASNLLNDNDEPSPDYGRHTEKHPSFISTSSSSSRYTNLPYEYDEPVYDVQTHQNPGLISSSTSPNSEYTNLSDDNDEPSLDYGGHTEKHPSFISTSSSSSGYTNLPDEYDEPVYDVQTHQNPGLISSSTSPNSEYTNLSDDNDEPSPDYGGHTEKHPSFISTSSSSSGYTNLPDEYDEPVYDVQTHQNPGLISSSTSPNSEYTNLSDDNDEPSPDYGGHTEKHPGFISTSSSSSGYTNLPDEYDEPVNDVQTHQHPSLISSSASNLLNDNDEPSPDNGRHTEKHPSFISTSSSSSRYKNLPYEYDEPVYDVQTHQHPSLISSPGTSNSKYTNMADGFDEPNAVNGGQILKYPGFISKALAHSKYTNLPNDYNNLIPDYANVVDDYVEPSPVYDEEIHKHPGFHSKDQSHSEYTIPNDYNNPIDDYEPVNGRPTENKDNLLVSYHPYGHTANIIKPSLIAHLQGNQPTGLKYLKYLKMKLAPTYRLFTLDNLLKLHNVVIKTIKVNGDEPDVYDNRALMNLKTIINIILKSAEVLKEPEGSIKWYEKIFYNTQKNRHPLEMYVYNLIRQRWLHELMLILHKNDFHFNIVLNPRIFSFLGSWQFPHHVLKFIEGKEHKQHNFDAPNGFDQTFSTQHGLQDKFSTHTYDDLLEEVPEDLQNYVTNNVINSYKTPNSGIVLSIAGVEAEPDANAIINILQKYLQYKSVIKKQENVIIRDNKVEMLNQIILFLKEKGYGATTIADLIRKLHIAVYSTEGKECQTHDTNFAKNMYDVILPVLRRSGR